MKFRKTFLMCITHYIFIILLIVYSSDAKSVNFKVYEYLINGTPSEDYTILINTSTISFTTQPSTFRTKKIYLLYNIHPEKNHIETWTITGYFKNKVVKPGRYGDRIHS
ncbi:MAG: hypothetical protein J7K83_00290, partial [Candidatus Aenigmarchaeota archaeon]|nr:hypothetical protein [Candidatus Aenigmarchaeota archaeon]